jgi:hypothetical protein
MVAKTFGTNYLFLTSGREHVYVEPTDGGETLQNNSELQASRTCQAFQHGSHPLQTCPTRYFELHYLLVLKILNDTGVKSAVKST